MRTTVRLSIGLVAAILIAGSLASCGDDEDPDPGIANPASETPTTETVTLHFSRDSEECDEVEAVTRTVEGGGDPEVVMGELLAGPNQAERDAGFGSWFSAATAGMLDSIEIDGGVARVSFDPELRQVISGASSSCGSANLLAQLDATVEGIAGVDRAIYALGGDVDAFYEWLQYDAPAR